MSSLVVPFLFFSFLINHQSPPSKTRHSFVVTTIDLTRSQHLTKLKSDVMCDRAFAGRGPGGSGTGPCMNSRTIENYSKFEIRPTMHQTLIAKCKMIWPWRDFSPIVLLLSRTCDTASSSQKISCRHTLLGSSILNEILLQNGCNFFCSDRNPLPCPKPMHWPSVVTESKEQLLSASFGQKRLNNFLTTNYTRSLPCTLTLHFNVVYRVRWTLSLFKTFSPLSHCILELFRGKWRLFKKLDPPGSRKVCWRCWLELGVWPKMRCGCEEPSLYFQANRCSKP